MKLLRGVITILSLLIFATCADQKVAEKRVEAEVKNEPVVKQSEIAANARDYIVNSTTLSPEQKTALLNLQQKTQAQSRAIQEDIVKSKMVLIKTLLTPGVNKREVSILKKELRKLSKQQIENSLLAIDEARKIISPMKNAEDKEYLFNTFMMRQNNAY